MKLTGKNTGSEPQKFIPTSSGDLINPLYVEWLEERIATLTRANTNLRNQIAAADRSQSRQARYDADYLPYGEDPYDR